MIQEVDTDDTGEPEPMPSNVERDHIFVSRCPFEQSCATGRRRLSSSTSTCFPLRHGGLPEVPENNGAVSADAPPASPPNNHNNSTHLCCVALPLCLTARCGHEQPSGM